MGLEHTALVDLRVQPERLDAHVGGHTYRSIRTPTHICIRSSIYHEDAAVLAHELVHLWGGASNTLPVLEEGMADLIAMRSVPEHSAKLLKLRQEALRALISSAALVPGSAPLLETGMAADWDAAREGLVGLDVRETEALYALGLEVYLRMESGEGLDPEAVLSVANSALLSFRLADSRTH